MRLKKLEIVGFKSFARKGVIEFGAPISAVVGPNGSGKSNVAESIRFVLGEQSMKSMRGKKGEDLIFNGSQQVGRLNHAKVTITFDNTDRGMKIDFDEVSISREVFRDGVHQYFINGSQVRLKDVIELLSSVHIGASGHHIISQGEADRILNASIKEKKVMIEDALGLKVYHWKIDESEKKLVKTEENIAEIDLLRREIGPQLRYLKKQVEKMQKAEELRNELGDLFQNYLKREEIYIRITSDELHLNLETFTKQKGELDVQISQYKQTIAEIPKNNEHVAKLQEAEEELRELRGKRSEVNREIGRVEGVIEYEQKKRVIVAEETHDEPPVPFKRVKDIVDSVKWTLGEALAATDMERVKYLLKMAEERLVSFMDTVESKEEVEENDTSNDDLLTELHEKKEVLRIKLEEIGEAENKGIERIKIIKEEAEAQNGTLRETERSLYQSQTERNQIQNRIESIDAELERTSHIKERFDEEVQGAVSFVGKRAGDFHDFEMEDVVVIDEERSKQDERRMKIERIKMRIEDMGGGSSGEDVLKEYQELQERDTFLENELNDLRSSAESLRTLLNDLLSQLESEFTVGIDKINVEFQKFFSLMFGGGSATLTLVTQQKRKKKSVENEEIEPSDAEEVSESGIDIDVILPRKKVKGLVMLSGGERALTSIALLFAMSQVKPPPFLILDETDAALDEANSRKYGDMLENLSKYSQLIVVTHNRQTMSRAGILYGVTMGADATSKLLSIKFDEAVEVAK